MKAKEALTVLLADKGSATVAVDTADYSRKIAARLEDNAYRKSAERKTAHLLKKSSSSEEVS